MLSVDDDGGTVYVELESNGLVVTLEGCDTSDVEVGSVVLLGDYGIDPAPEELWREQSWVGVVRLKRPRKTVISRGGQWVAVPTRTDIEYSETNSVEVTDRHGVLEVVDEEPLHSFNFVKDEEIDVSRFKVEDNSEQDTNDGVTFDDFGGMKSVVERARELIEVPLTYREALTEMGARPIKGCSLPGRPAQEKRCWHGLSLRKRSQPFIGSVAQRCLQNGSERAKKRFACCSGMWRLY